jgi:hypothetical protein
VVTLDIDPRIADPRSFMDSMAASRLPWRSEISIANTAKIGEAHMSWVIPHPPEDDFNSAHINDTNNDTIVKSYI